MKTNDLILVIDMQNVYLPGEPWACLHMDDVVKNIQNIVNLAEEKKDSVIFTLFMPDPHAKYTWASYNKINQKVNDNPWMNEMIDDLRPYAEKHSVYQKPVYSALHIQDVKDACRYAAERNGRIILTGVVDDCCVLSTFFDAMDEGNYMVWIKDAVGGITEEKHKAAENVVEGLAYCHCALMNTNEYLKEND